MHTSSARLPDPPQPYSQSKSGSAEIKHRVVIQGIYIL
jgi:hypothetical protein